MLDRPTLLVSLMPSGSTPVCNVTSQHSRYGDQPPHVFPTPKLILSRKSHGAQPAGIAINPSSTLSVSWLTPYGVPRRRASGNCQGAHASISWRLGGGCPIPGSGVGTPWVRRHLRLNISRTGSAEAERQRMSRGVRDIAVNNRSRVLIIIRTSQRGSIGEDNTGISGKKRM